eukprot:CAMPEP_0170992470 /NCGR_PEP_ID=MMETSP0736-20130129/9766_1 /TAXON_ID=186038 /ORGANISM="Fragilariopsis kerguelensis, Strain L26-C5" /LENGTH=37 /DNA_ID= /DNA_START= /DNA_END= /DNA_ORIENTATION=
MTSFLITSSISSVGRLTGSPSPQAVAGLAIDISIVIA